MVAGATGWELVSNEFAERRRERQRRRLAAVRHCARIVRVHRAAMSQGAFAFKEIGTGERPEIAWCTSQVAPLRREDRDLSDEDLHAKRCL